MLLGQLFQFELFKFVVADLHLFLHDYHIFDLGFIYEIVYFLFEFFLECLLSLQRILLLLQPIQVQKLFFPDRLMTLLENYVFVIGMDVMDELSGCFRVDD